MRVRVFLLELSMQRRDVRLSLLEERGTDGSRVYKAKEPGADVEYISEWFSRGTQSMYLV